MSIQWLVIIFYLICLVLPAFLPIPQYNEHIYNNFALLSKFIFWGIWWPFVIVSVVCFGRLWCGIFCPEGAIAELTSKKLGRAKTIPRWVKWKGWPIAAFSITTIYGQLISVYDYAKPALLILGGSTIFAIIISFLYGAKGTRVWCRYLCPVSGVFNLLSRLAPMSYKVDEEKWKGYEHSAEKTTNPNCAPMIKLHQLNGVSACHMCGRCSGFRDSIVLQPRSVNEEIVKYGAFQTTIWDKILLTFAMIGLAIGAFTWTKSPFFSIYKEVLGTYLINHNMFWALESNAPWWILTHYPAIADSFNWLDGFCIITYILASSLIIGVVLNLIIYLCQMLSGKKILANHLSMALTPIALANLFLGLSSTTVTLLKAEDINISCISFLRILILFVNFCWSLWLCYKITQRYEIKAKSQYAIIFCFAIAPAIIITIWIYMFWIW